MERSHSRNQSRYSSWAKLPRKDFQEGGRRSALFPSIVLAFASRGLSRSASEENARASHLVERHCYRGPTSDSRAPRQAAGSISCFLRLHSIRVVAVPPPLFHLSFTA